MRGGIRWVMVSAYFQYAEDGEESVNLIDKILEKITAADVVIGADVNSKSTMGIVIEQMEEAKKNEELISKYKMVVLNREGQPTKFSSTRRELNRCDNG